MKQGQEQLRHDILLIEMSNDGWFLSSFLLKNRRVYYRPGGALFHYYYIKRNKERLRVQLLSNNFGVAFIFTTP